MFPQHIPGHAYSRDNVRDDIKSLPPIELAHALRAQSRDKIEDSPRYCLVVPRLSSLYSCMTDYRGIPSTSSSISRPCLLPKQSPSTRKQSPPSFRLWMTGCSSISMHGRRSTMSPMKDCQRCPHCNSIPSGHNQTHFSHSQSRSDNDHLKISLQEALTSIPYSKATEEARPTPAKCIPKPKETTLSAKGLSLLPSTHRATFKGFWSRNFSRAPARPTRPPVEQCPPAPQLPLRLNTASYNDSKARHGGGIDSNRQRTGSKPAPPQQPWPRNLHHDLALNLLIGNDVKLNHTLSGADHEQQHLATRGQMDAEAVSQLEFEQMTHSSGLSYSPNYSFSSLPTTASKVALKPSPLRLIKEDDVFNEAPAIPSRSPLRPSPFAKGHVTASSDIKDSLGTDVLTSTRTRCSSFTTASVYSSDDDQESAQQNEIPHSSPLLFPCRSSSLGQPLSKDANEQAEKTREELGIIGDIYNMHKDTKSARRGRHDALVDGIQGQVTRLSEGGNAPTLKVSRTLKRAARERARSEIAQKLLRPHTDAKAQHAELERWLDFVQAQDPCNDECNNGSHSPSDLRHESLTQPNSDFSRHVHQQLRTSGEAEHGCKAVPESSFDRDDQPSMSSIAHSPSLSSSSQTSVSTAASEDMPLNLQRAVIEWKGRRYHVLIGERGKIWEGPCNRDVCEEHGKRKPAIRYGMM